MCYSTRPAAQRRAQKGHCHPRLGPEPKPTRAKPGCPPALAFPPQTRPLPGWQRVRGLGPPELLAPSSWRPGAQSTCRPALACWGGRRLAARPRPRPTLPSRRVPPHPRHRRQPQAGQKHRVPDLPEEMAVPIKPPSSCRASPSDRGQQPSGGPPTQRPTDELRRGLGDAAWRAGGQEPRATAPT